MEQVQSSRSHVVGKKRRVVVLRTSSRTSLSIFKWTLENVDGCSCSSGTVQTHPLPGLSRGNENRLFSRLHLRKNATIMNIILDFCRQFPHNPGDRTSEQINLIYEKRFPLSACFCPDFYRMHIRRRIITPMRFYGDCEGFMFKHIVMTSTEIKGTFPQI